ncbi:hypothetical protein [Helicobacter ailurogastricus]|uniref:hypothetical protein n=1 Tax=Helicobacter ailurogastricus TaxID=1578720 RepID=UPI001315AA4F|nr:hypothetical protein [Helicobacter ailurogastricus]
MKTSPSPQKKSRSSTSISFVITAVLYALGIGVFFASHPDHIERLAQAGNQSITMSLASIDTHATHLEHTKQAPTPPKKEEPKPQTAPIHI